MRVNFGSNFVFLFFKTYNGCLCLIDLFCKYLMKRVIRRGRAFYIFLLILETCFRFRYLLIFRNHFRMRFIVFTEQFSPIDFILI